MAKDPIQLPIELVDRIARFALDSVQTFRFPGYAVGDDPTEDAQSALLHRLRLVCKEWASHFFCHGLFQRFTFKNDEQFRKAMEFWSLAVPPSSTRSRLVSATQPRMPVIQELTLLNLRHNETTPARKTRSKKPSKKRSQPHLSMSTAVRIIELFAQNLTHLHVNFVDCFYFPQSLIDAASKTSQFVSLTLSIVINGWNLNRPPNGPPPPEPTAMHPETLFEFLAAVPKLSQLTLVNWDIPFPFKCSSQIASHHITHLSLLGPGDGSVNTTHQGVIVHSHTGFLLAMSHLFVSSLKAMCLVGVDIDLIEQFTEVIAACGKTLEVLSILTQSPQGLSVLGATPLPMLKVLQLDYIHLYCMSHGPRCIQSVETLVVEISMLMEELENLERYNKTAEQVRLRWRSMISKFPKLKRLAIIDTLDGVTEDIMPAFILIEGIEVIMLKSRDYLHLTDLERLTLNQSRSIYTY